MKRGMTRIKILEIYATILLISVVAALIYVWTASSLGTSDRVGITTAISTVALVIVTGIYAWHTRKMAEEMREQRYIENLPLIIPVVTRRSIVNKNLELNEIDYGTLQTGIGLEVTWHNLGKGVAINTRLSFWSPHLDSNPGKALFFPPQESQTLGVGERKEFKPDKTWAGQWYDISDAYPPKLEAEYCDIYERKVTTVQEFRIDEQNKRAFLGELYFTVNGRRLGQEVTQYD